MIPVKQPNFFFAVGHAQQKTQCLDERSCACSCFGQPRGKLKQLGILCAIRGAEERCK